MWAAGEWVRVRARNGSVSVAQFGSSDGKRAWVGVYRSSRPEAMMWKHVKLAWVLGVAEESEELQAARELVEIDSLRDRRQRLGITQRDFAELVGVNPAAVRDAEHGRRHTQKRIRHWLLMGLRKLEAAA